jgi:hypothetical protein
VNTGHVEEPAASKDSIPLHLHTDKVLEAKEEEDDDTLFCS